MELRQRKLDIQATDEISVFHPKGGSISEAGLGNGD
jgi:hypothetical protein